MAKRHARLTHAHLDSAIKNPERARWKAFEESKSRLLKSSSAVAVANWESCGPDNQRGMMMIIRTTSH